MSVSKLRQLVTPPNRPFEPGTIEQWASVESKLGLSLPSDYKDFLHSYGTGTFAAFYVIYNPFSSIEAANLLAKVETLCQQEREFKRDFPQAVPYRIYPERPGLLPWGGDENGNYYYWFTNGAPGAWKVISNEVRGDGFQEHGRCMTDFLCDVLTGEIPALAGDYPKDEYLHFESWEKYAEGV
jgi:hypothetical protein